MGFNVVPLVVNPWVFVCKTLKNMPYEPQTAIAELIDNSSVAIKKLKEVERKTFGQIDFTYNATNDIIEIFDNGIGFSNETRAKVKLYGTEEETYDSRNRYNVGMKNALYWLGNEFEIRSFDRQEKKVYSKSIKLYVDKINGDVFEWHEVNDNNFYGTKISIKDVRKIASNKQLFENNILDPIKEIYRIDLLESNYKLNAYYIAPNGEKYSYEDLKPTEIKFQYDDEGIKFEKTKIIKDPETKDRFTIHYQIMSKDTKERLKKSGFHVYYKDRKISTFTVPEVLGSNTNIYKRTYAQIFVNSPETQLSFLKDDLSISLNTKAFLFQEIRDLFHNEIKDFFDSLSRKEKMDRESKKENTNSSLSFTKEEAKVSVNMPLDERGESNDYIIFTHNNREIQFTINRDPSYNIGIKIEKIFDNEYELFIREDLATDENIKLIIYTTLVKDGIFTDIADLIENGELA